MKVPTHVDCWTANITRAREAHMGEKQRYRLSSSAEPDNQHLRNIGQLLQKVLLRKLSFPLAQQEGPQQSTNNKRPCRTSDRVNTIPDRKSNKSLMGSFVPTASTEAEVQEKAWMSRQH